jgi:hypothetical protein
MNNAHSFGDKTGLVPIAFNFLDNLSQDFCTHYLEGADFAISFCASKMSKDFFAGCFLVYFSITSAVQYSC